MTLFDPDLPPQMSEQERLLEALASALRGLITAHGFDAVEATLGRIKIQMAGPLSPVPVRPSDPRTSQAAGTRHRSQDLRRFSSRSQCGHLLDYFVLVGQATDKQATDSVVGAYAEIPKWEGCRRRCSDLRRAGYLEDTGEEIDGRIVWRATAEGRSAHHNMTVHGWTRRRSGEAVT